MADPNDNAITRLLTIAGAGDHRAVDTLLPLVYDQLRALAWERMAAEGAGHTLQATALVHEAYLRLVGAREVAWAGRAHFYAAAAEAIRRILTDHARKRQRLKRGGVARRVPLNVVDLAAKNDPDTILILDEAIWRLDKSDAVLAQVVRLRFYAGLSIAETAQAMNLSEPTIKRHWRAARAWLYDALREKGG